VIPIVVGALGTVAKGLEKSWKQWTWRRGSETGI